MAVRVWHADDADDVDVDDDDTTNGVTNYGFKNIEIILIFISNGFHFIYKI